MIPDFYVLACAVFASFFLVPLVIPRKEANARLFVLACLLVAWDILLLRPFK